MVNMWALHDLTVKYFFKLMNDLGHDCSLLYVQQLMEQREKERQKRVAEKRARDMKKLLQWGTSCTWTSSLHQNSHSTDRLLYTLYCEVSWVWVLARVQDDIICIALKMTSSCALGTSGYNVMWCDRLARWASVSHMVLLCMLLDLCCRKQEEYQQCQPHEQEAAALFEEVGI